MNGAEGSPPTETEVVHDRLFVGLASFEAVARATGRSTRTVYNWVARGMPIRYVGSRPYAILAKLPEFLDAIGPRRVRPRDLEPPRRGRPRKHLQRIGSEDRRR
jgi:hypothetical protein